MAEKKQKCPKAIILDDTENFLLKCPHCWSILDSRKYGSGRHACPVCKNAFRIK